MFTFVSDALITTGRELAKIPAHYEQWDLVWQQDVCARLIDAYRTFAVSTQALYAAHREVVDLASNATTPTKVVMRKKLATLQHALQDFGDSVVTAFGLQRKQSHFLHSDLLVEVMGPKSLWFNPPRSIHLYALTCPEYVSGSGQRAGYQVRYPTVYPVNHFVDLDRYRRNGQFQLSLQELKTQIPADLREQLGYILIDIRDADGLALALQQYPSNLDMVQEVREQLARSLQQTYSLERLLR